MDEPNKILSKQEALELLTNSNALCDDNKIFDEFGNYVFPTDIKVEEPNVAIGSLYIINKP